MASFLKRDLAASKRFKAKLQAREITTLIHSSHPSPSLVERLGQYGFDAVLIDAEHGSVGRERVEEMSRAAALAGIAAIIRPEGSLPHLVTGYIGCGVDGFMLPLIRSIAQAEELLYMSRFSAPLDHGDRIVILMIETIQAVECLTGLLELTGVDAFLVAQSDLAISMGVTSFPDARPFQPPSLPPQVLATIDRAIAMIVDAGKVCGARVTYDDAGSYLSKGVTLLYDHTDNLLARAAKDFLAKMGANKRRAAERPPLEVRP